ncbi:hypothetical protein ACM64Y_13975 [Novispirillum sp. DQ9]|uniref:hypothetical protein n=1 Tax=Novispirillum sp. DQ9 TaxID=3398612 RepID=UPI003C7BD226
MARPNLSSNADKAKLLRSLAFEIHRKQPADDVLRAVIDDQLRLGKRKEFRPAQEALNDNGFAAALRAMDVLSDDAAIILGCLVDGGDHRLQSAALTKLAEFLEEG